MAEIEEYCRDILCIVVFRIYLKEVLFQIIMIRCLLVAIMKQCAP